MTICWLIQFDHQPTAVFTGFTIKPKPSTFTQIYNCLQEGSIRHFLATIHKNIVTNRYIRSRETLFKVNKSDKHSLQTQSTTTYDNYKRFQQAPKYCFNWNINQ